MVYKLTCLHDSASKVRLVYYTVKAEGKCTEHIVSGYTRNAACFGEVGEELLFGKTVHALRCLFFAELHSEFGSAGEFTAAERFAVAFGKIVLFRSEKVDSFTAAEFAFWSSVSHTILMGMEMK